MTDHRKRSDITPGMMVVIREYPSQKTQDFPEGIVSVIRDSDEYNPDGVLVELTNEAIGNIQLISGAENSIDDITRRLHDRENQRVERKSTFAFDIRENKENPDLKTVLAIATASLMNTDGGFVYVGVKDDGTPIGLELDYSIMKNRPNDDGFEDMVRNFFNKVLTDSVSQQNCLTFSFPVIDSKEICEIHVKPSNRPIFIQSKIGRITFQGSRDLTCQAKKQRHFEDFYIRRGNSHYLIEKGSEFYNYTSSRFSQN